MSENLHPGQPSSMASGKGPFAPTTASLGLTPTAKVDIPITAVFLLLFLLGAVAHMTIFQLNKKKGHKFIMSGLMFGFCMSRLATCSLRIAWSTHPQHIPLAIAASVFVSAGVVLLFIINIIFTQRILRATHPHFGWHRALSLAFKIYYATIVLTLFMLITCTVQSFYTQNHNTRRIDRDVQLYGGTYFAVTAFFPIPALILGYAFPRTTRVEKFGQGRFRSKIIVLLTGATLLTLGASFRAGTAIKTPRQRNNPAWYHSKACFYIFDFTIEILVIYLYAAVRVDRRFHIPNGSHGPGDYSGANNQRKDDFELEHQRPTRSEDFSSDDLMD
ncbi:MAG: hypothetical protein M1835_005010 [Candelina submexicana]|nr:MAG: hypothetical protein M1835_005010 [Candelina submexicana]